MPIIAILIILASGSFIVASKVPAAKAVVDANVAKVESYIPAK
jgi:hypothetical protein